MSKFLSISRQLETISVQDIVPDFELKIFSVVKDCFPNISHFGCSFHYKQVVLRKAKLFGFLQSIC